MGGVVYHLQAVLVGNGLYGLRIHWPAVAVHGHDGRGLRRDGSFDFVRVHATGALLDVHEDGLAAVPPNAVGRGHETIGRGDDLTRDSQCLQSGQQRQRTVGEQADIRHLEVFA